MTISLTDLNRYADMGQKSKERKLAELIELINDSNLVNYLSKPKGNTMEIKTGQTQIKVDAGGRGKIWVDVDQVANDYRDYIIATIKECNTEYSNPEIISFEDYVRGER